MGTRRSAWWIGLAVLGLLVAEMLVVVHQLGTPPPQSATVPAASSSLSRIERNTSSRTVNPHVFTVAETEAFLAAATKAEAIADPLQRCLAYPDPPRSHWTRATVVAYCQYRNQPVITFAQVRDLIEHGKSAELDRLMAQALQAQQTQPQAHGQLDHLFFVDFDNGSFDIRPTLDAWKRDSPDSAFAYAASGSAYVAMAWNARGGAYISDTPQSNIDAMNRLLMEADSDLERAMALNPQVTPIYVAMMRAGSLSLGRDYIHRAVRRGLAVAPDNYSIYGMLSAVEEPRWGGSLEAMDRVAQQAQAHVKQNPLLAIMLSVEPAYRYDVCNCRSSANWRAYPTVFDNVASETLLTNAGNAASKNGHPKLGVIYLSEALRFQPGALNTRRQRDTDLAYMGEAQLALDDANRLIAGNPNDERNYVLRGNVYLFLMRVRDAESDFEHALAMAPDDIDVLGPLGGIYIDQTHEWDKAWDVTDRIIREYPGSPAGWVMRATIQESQPRAGLGDTYRYFVEHFGHDPSMQWQIAHIRQVLSKAPLKTPIAKTSKNR